MGSWTFRALMFAVVLGAVGAAVILNFWPASEAPEPRTPPEKPPTEAEFRALFQADKAGFETLKDLLVGLPRESMSIQRGYLSWPGVDGHGWSLREGDRWWASDGHGGRGTWKDSDTVYREAGIRAEDHARVSAFLARHGLFHVALGREDDGVGRVVVLSSRQGLTYAWLEREIVWHTNPRPYSQDSTYVYSETNRVPQETRERELPAPGWFVRTTTRFGGP